MDSTHEVLRDIALFSVSFANLVKELEKELEAHVALIGRLEARVIELEQKASQGTTVTDLYCRDQLDKLEDQIKHLEQKADAKEEKLEDIHQKVDILMIAGRKGYSMTDLGNMVDEISKEGLLDDYINEKISDHPDVASEDSIREWARDEAQEVLSNASFDITVN